MIQKRKTEAIGEIKKKISIQSRQENPHLIGKTDIESPKVLLSVRNVSPSHHSRS